MLGERRQRQLKPSSLSLQLYYCHVSTFHSSCVALHHWQFGMRRQLYSILTAEPTVTASDNNGYHFSCYSCYYLLHVCLCMYFVSSKLWVGESSPPWQPYIYTFRATITTTTVWHLWYAVPVKTMHTTNSFIVVTVKQAEVERVDGWTTEYTNNNNELKKKCTRNGWKYNKQLQPAYTVVAAAMDDKW